MRGRIFYKGRKIIQRLTYSNLNHTIDFNITAFLKNKLLIVQQKTSIKTKEKAGAVSMRLCYCLSKAHNFFNKMEEGFNEHGWG